MMNYLGDFTTSNTVYVFFNTFDSNDPSASVTLTGLVLGDILIYKNGSVVQRSSTAGFTLLDTDGIDFDTKTGIHGFSIDLSDNTDAGFYAAGGEYTVVVASVTVDAATVNFVAASFSIERTGGALALLKGTNSLANIEDKIDIIDTVVDSILVDTAVIGAAGAGLTALGGMSTGMKAQVNAECDTALVDYDAVIPADLNDPTAAAIADAVWDETQAAHVTAGSFGEIATEIAAIPTTAMRGTDGANTTTPPTVGAVADAVWDEAQAGHVAVGSFGEIATEIAAIPTTAMRGTDNAAQASVCTEARLAELDAANLPTDIAAVQSDTDNIQTRLPAALVGGRMDSDVGAIQAGAITASAIATDAIDADALAASAITEIRSVFNGTADSGTTTTLIDAALTQADANYWDNMTILFTSGNLLGQTATIIAFSAVADRLTFAPAVTQAVTTHTYEILPTSQVVDVLNVLTEGITSLSISDAALTAAKFATDAVDANALATDAVNEIADGVKGRQLTEAYAADGVAPTLEQATMAILQQAGEFAISGTTITVKKLDGIATAMTFTLDDATNPTSRTRAT